jgi:amidase
MEETEIWKWDAATVAAAIRSGKISSREAVTGSLSRLNAVNPLINAVVDVMEEEALAAASAADAALARGEATGLLHGVPVTTKMNVDTAGRATTNGLVAFKDAVAAEDSSSVANLARAGAIVVGRTNVPAFSYRWFTSNDLHGTTYNPWNPKLSPGGSSGGGAAAAAVGIGTLAHGNDVAGSLRLPASACGIYGLKPTVGRLPSYNPSQIVEKSLCLQIGATEGVMGRSVLDLQLGLAALEVHDYRDPDVAPHPRGRADDNLPCRVALYTGLPGDDVHPEIVDLTLRAASWLEDAGYCVEEVELPDLTEIAELWMSMLYAESTGPVRETLFALGGEAFKTSFLNTAANYRELTQMEFHQAWQRRLAIKRKWAELFSTYPIALTPTSFQPVFPLDYDLEGPQTLRLIAKAYRPLAAIAGLSVPAISVPVGFVNGAPAGVQIVSSWFREERCLSAAAIMEQRIGKMIPIDPRGLDPIKPSGKIGP